MSHSTNPASPSSSGPARRRGRPGSKELVQCDSYIDRQIEQTRRTVKLVDIASTLLVMATALLGFFLLFAVVEHWLLPGGFGEVLRTILLGVMALACLVYAWRELWPLVLSRINPAYAAQTIEQANPSLKNSLLNLLLFRGRREEMPAQVYQALEQQAARGLSRVPVGTAVDRTHLIHIGYVFAGLVLLCALYTVISPKDPFVSVSRVLLPWADIAPASRVSISAVQPGTATVTQGERVTVTAEVRGIGADDDVRLRYSTDDGQVVAQEVAMRADESGRQFTGDLGEPLSLSGLVGVQRDLRYWIEAGDARTRRFHLQVVAAPTMTVTRVEYDYPEYTGYADRDRDAAGDIRAIEGTRVTIHGLANVPIAEAFLDFEADGRLDVPMDHIGTESEVQFTLALRADRRTPTNASYALRITAADGRENRQPVLHKIDVIPDLSPEVEISAPEEKARDIRLNESVSIETEARDPDFALSAVRLRGEVGGEQVIDEPLLQSEHSGRYTGRFRLQPSRHGLRVGDVLEYWIAAYDNRTPAANMTETTRQRLRVVSPDPNRPPEQDQLAQREQVAGEGEQGGEDSGQQGTEGGEQGAGGGEQNAENGGQGAQDGEQGAESGGQGAESGEQGAESGEQGAESEQQTDGQGGQGGSRKGNEGQQEGEAGGRGGQSGEQNGEGESSDDQSQPGQTDGAGSPEGADPTTGQTPGDGSTEGDATREGASDGQRGPSNGQRPGDPSSDQTEGGGREGAADGQPSQPVSPKGDNDGEAFERIQRHLDEQGERSTPDEQNGESATPSDREQSRDGESGGRRQPSTGEGPGAETRSGDPPQEESAGAEERKQSESPGGQQTSTRGPSGGGDQPEQDRGGTDSNSQLQPRDKRTQDPSGSQRQDDAEPSAPAEGKQQSDSHGEQGGDRPGGGQEGGGQQAQRDGTGSAGQNQSADEGAGESSEQGAGRSSPNAGRDAQSSKPTGQPGDESAGEGSSRRDGQGDQDGGRRGEQGEVGDPPGEKGDPSQSEEGGAGQRSQTDQSEQGARGAQGDPSEAGDQSEQNGQGAQPDEDDLGAKNEPGGENELGGEGEPAESGERSAGESGDGQQPDERGENQRSTDSSREDAQQQSSDGQQPGAPSKDSPGSSNGGSTTGGGGRQGAAARPQVSPDGGEPGGDAANLDYARQQTDLILDKLSNMLDKEKVDDQMLDDLGWTQGDLRRFVERWRARQAAADSQRGGTESAQRKLDAALRSLGLRPRSLGGQTQRKQDTFRDLRQGPRVPVPPEFRDRLRAYNQGVSEGQNGDGSTGGR